MAGVTDTVFRRFIRHASMFSVENTMQHVGQSVDTPVSNQQSGCGLIMTEFTSADGLARMRDSKRKRYLTFYDDEHPIAAQLFGSNPVDTRGVGKDLRGRRLRHRRSSISAAPPSALLPATAVPVCCAICPLIGEIFKAVRAAISIPFTVKFRMGWNDRNIVCVELARMAEDCGLNAVALHARTREDGYTGQARWEWIAAVKDAVSIPVIGNGDVRTPEDAAAMVEQTRCDAVMIGRVAPANPWIFRQIAQYTATGRYDSPTEQDRYRMIREYFGKMIAEVEQENASETARAEALTAAGQSARERTTRDCVGKMKQFAAWFTHGVQGGGALRKQIFEAKNGAAVLDAVDTFFTGSRERAPEAEPEHSANEEAAALAGAVCD